MTNAELDAACKAIREPQPPGWGEALRGAIPVLRLEPGKGCYSFSPGREITKLTLKKRSNWRHDVKIVSLPDLQKCLLLTPNISGTVVSAAIDPKGNALWVYPSPLDAGELEIEYAAQPVNGGSDGKESDPVSAAAKRPLLSLPGRQKPA